MSKEIAAKRCDSFYDALPYRFVKMMILENSLFPDDDRLVKIMYRAYFGNDADRDVVFLVEPKKDKMVVTVDAMYKKNLDNRTVLSFSWSGFSARRAVGAISAVTDGY